MVTTTGHELSRMASPAQSSPERRGSGLRPRWRHSVPRRSTDAAVLVVGGTVLLSVGVGVGMPWARTVGWSVVTVAGVLALVLGLVLWFGGMVGLARSGRRWGRWLVPPVALVVTALLGYVMAVPLAVVTAPQNAVGHDAAATSRLSAQEVRMPSRDGEVLAGWYVPSENGAAVVVRHGAGSSRSSVLRHAVVLAEHGYGVLMTDARGQGESTGRAMEWGWHGDDDIDAALTYLSGRSDVDPGRIGVVGLSMGGEEAVGAAAFDGRILAVVAEGATARSAADLGWLETAYGWRGAVTRWVHVAQTRLVELLVGHASPTPLAKAAARAQPRPVLLVVAGAVADEQHAAAAIQAASPRSVRVWVVPGARHTGGLKAAPEQWEQRVVGFLDQALQTR